MHNLIQAARRFGAEKELFEYFDELFRRKAELRLDPIAGPIGDYVRTLPHRGSKGDLDRIVSQLARLQGIVQKGQHLFEGSLTGSNLFAAIGAKQKLILEARKKADAG